MRLIPAVVALPLLFAVSAQAQDLPPRKPGLWDIKTTVEGRKLPIKDVRHCVDQSTDKMMNSALGLASWQACSKKDVQKSGNTTTIDSVCKVSGVTNTSHTVITGSFDSAYTVTIASMSEGGEKVKGMPKGEHNVMIEAKYLGACERGQKPGDIMIGDGIKINIQNMPQLGGLLGGLLQ